MKELIKKALDDSWYYVEKIVPTTKTVQRFSDDLFNVSPLALLDFMNANNIPTTAKFDVKDDNDWNCDICPILTWDEEVLTTEQDQIDFKRIHFKRASFKSVSAILKLNGYRLRNRDYGQLTEFSNTTIYDMYMNGEEDKLVRYYSLYFSNK